MAKVFAVKARSRAALSAILVAILAFSFAIAVTTVASLVTLSA